MAKGWKLTTSRSERLLGSFSNYGHSHSHSHVHPDTVAESELAEEDIWSMVDDTVDRRRSQWVPCPKTLELAASERRRSATNLHTNHRRNNVGGLSLAFEETNSNTSSSRIVHHHQFRNRENGSTKGSTGGNGSVQRRSGPFMATSAPVNVPDWSKIYRVNSVDSMHDPDEWAEDELDSEMIPPHEYLARSRNKAATSVFEGVGRTLKGRDLSRVRDAVWSQTGFDG